MKILLSAAAIDYLHRGGFVHELEVISCKRCGRLVHITPSETTKICETCQAAAKEKHECVQ